MKASNDFKEVIKNYLDNRAKEDILFAKTYSKENKNIDDCITYILNQVKSSGCNGFADNEIFNMAIHYYDENDIKVGGKLNCDVVVNHSVDKHKQTDKPEEIKKETKPKATKKTIVLDNQITMEL